MSTNTTPDREAVEAALQELSKPRVFVHMGKFGDAIVTTGEAYKAGLLMLRPESEDWIPVEKGLPDTDNELWMTVRGRVLSGCYENGEWYVVEDDGAYLIFDHYFLPPTPSPSAWRYKEQKPAPYVPAAERGGRG